MSSQILAAVDIGGTKVTASVSGKKGILAKVRMPTALTGDYLAIPRQVDSMIQAAAREAGLGVDRVAAVGVSTCSPFQKRGAHTVIVAPNLCGGLGWSRKPIPNDWTFVPLEQELRSRYPRVEVGNDCITAAVAERLFGAGQGEDNLLYVTWSTGIGAGAFVDGHLITGKNNNAVHLGHVLMDLDDNRSLTEGWQDAANLESFVAGPAIARLYGTGLDTLAVFRDFRRGDAKAQDVVKRAARAFARALVTATTLFDTRLIIVGGSVSNDWDVLEPLVTDEFRAGNPFFVGGVEFRRSALDRFLGDMAGLSTVMPKDWVAKWKRERPWEKAPEAITAATDGNRT
jgi:glucokinase